MNHARRSELVAAIALLEATLARIEPISAAEREAFGNLSQNLQNNDDGQRLEANAASLEAAVANVRALIDELGEIK